MLSSLDGVVVGVGGLRPPVVTIPDTGKPAKPEKSFEAGKSTVLNDKAETEHPPPAYTATAFGTLYTATPAAETLPDYDSIVQDGRTDSLAFENKLAAPIASVAPAHTVTSTEARAQKTSVTDRPEPTVEVSPTHPTTIVSQPDSAAVPARTGFGAPARETAGLAPTTAAESPRTTTPHATSGTTTARGPEPTATTPARTTTTDHTPSTAAEPLRTTTARAQEPTNPARSALGAPTAAIETLRTTTETPHTTPGATTARAPEPTATTPTRTTTTGPEPITATGTPRTTTTPALEATNPAPTPTNLGAPARTTTSHLAPTAATETLPGTTSARAREFTNPVPARTGYLTPHTAPGTTTARAQEPTSPVTDPIHQTEQSTTTAETARPRTTSSQADPAVAAVRSDEPVAPQRSEAADAGAVVAPVPVRPQLLYTSDRVLAGAAFLPPDQAVVVADAFAGGAADHLPGFKIVLHSTAAGFVDHFEDRTSRVVETGQVADRIATLRRMLSTAGHTAPWRNLLVISCAADDVRTAELRTLAHRAGITGDIRSWTGGRRVEVTPSKTLRILEPGEAPTPGSLVLGESDLPEITFRRSERRLDGLQERLVTGALPERSFIVQVNHYNADQPMTPVLITGRGSAKNHGHWTGYHRARYVRAKYHAKFEQLHREATARGDRVPPLDLLKGLLIIRGVRHDPDTGRKRTVTIDHTAPPRFLDVYQDVQRNSGDGRDPVGFHPGGHRDGATTAPGLDVRVAFDFDPGPQGSSLQHYSTLTREVRDLTSVSRPGTRPRYGWGVRPGEGTRLEIRSLPTPGEPISWWRSGALLSALNSTYRDHVGGPRVTVTLPDTPDRRKILNRAIQLVKAFEAPLYWLANEPGDETGHRDLDNHPPLSWPAEAAHPRELPYVHWRTREFGDEPAEDAGPPARGAAILNLGDGGEESLEFRLWGPTASPGVLQARVEISAAIVRAAADAEKAHWIETALRRPHLLGDPAATGFPQRWRQLHELLDLLDLDAQARKQVVQLAGWTAPWQANPAAGHPAHGQAVWVGRQQLMFPRPGQDVASIAEDAAVMRPFGGGTLVYFSLNPDQTRVLLWDGTEVTAQEFTRILGTQLAHVVDESIALLPERLDAPAVRATGSQVPAIVAESLTRAHRDIEVVVPWTAAFDGPDEPRWALYLSTMAGRPLPWSGDLSSLLVRNRPRPDVPPAYDHGWIPSFRRTDPETYGTAPVFPPRPTADSPTVGEAPPGYQPPVVPSGSPRQASPAQRVGLGLNTATPPPQDGVRDAALTAIVQGDEVVAFHPGGVPGGLTASADRIGVTLEFFGPNGRHHQLGEAARQRFAELTDRRGYDLVRPGDAPQAGEQRWALVQDSPGDTVLRSPMAPATVLWDELESALAFLAAGTSSGELRLAATIDVRLDGHLRPEVHAWVNRIFAAYGGTLHRLAGRPPHTDPVRPNPWPTTNPRSAVTVRDVHRLSPTGEEAVDFRRVGPVDAPGTLSFRLWHPGDGAANRHPGRLQLMTELSLAVVHAAADPARRPRIEAALTDPDLVEAGGPDSLRRLENLIELLEPSPAVADQIIRRYAETTADVTPEHPFRDSGLATTSGNLHYPGPGEVTRDAHTRLTDLPVVRHGHFVRLTPATGWRQVRTWNDGFTGAHPFAQSVLRRLAPDDHSVVVLLSDEPFPDRTDLAGTTIPERISRLAGPVTVRTADGWLVFHQGHVAGQLPAMEPGLRLVEATRWLLASELPPRLLRSADETVIGAAYLPIEMADHVEAAFARGAGGDGSEFLILVHSTDEGAAEPLWSGGSRFTDPAGLSGRLRDLRLDLQRRRIPHRPWTQLALVSCAIDDAFTARVERFARRTNTAGAVTSWSRGHLVEITDTTTRVLAPGESPTHGSVLLGDRHGRVVWPDQGFGEFPRVLFPDNRTTITGEFRNDVVRLARVIYAERLRNYRRDGLAGPIRLMGGGRSLFDARRTGLRRAEAVYTVFQQTFVLENRAGRAVGETDLPTVLDLLEGIEVEGLGRHAVQLDDEVPRGEANQSVFVGEVTPERAVGHYLEALAESTEGRFLFDYFPLGSEQFASHDPEARFSYRFDLTARVDRPGDVERNVGEFRRNAIDNLGPWLDVDVPAGSGRGARVSRSLLRSDDHALGKLSILGPDEGAQAQWRQLSVTCSLLSAERHLLDGLPGLRIEARYGDETSPETLRMANRIVDAYVRPVFAADADPAGHRPLTLTRPGDRRSPVSFAFWGPTRTPSAVQARIELSTAILRAAAKPAKHDQITRAATDRRFFSGQAPVLSDRDRWVRLQALLDLLDLPALSHRMAVQLYAWSRPYAARLDANARPHYYRAHNGRLLLLAPGDTFETATEAIDALPPSAGHVLVRYTATDDRADALRADGTPAGRAHLTGLIEAALSGSGETKLILLPVSPEGKELPPLAAPTAAPSLARHLSVDLARTVYVVDGATLLAVENGRTRSHTPAGSIESVLEWVDDEHQLPRYPTEADRTSPGRRQISSRNGESSRSAADVEPPSYLDDFGAIGGSVRSPRGPVVATALTRTGTTAPGVAFVFPDEVAATRAAAARLALPEGTVLAFVHHANGIFGAPSPHGGRTELSIPQLAETFAELPLALDGWRRFTHLRIVGCDLTSPVIADLRQSMAQHRVLSHLRVEALHTGVKVRALADGTLVTGTTLSPAPAGSATYVRPTGEQALPAAGGEPAPIPSPATNLERLPPGTLTLGPRGGQLDPGNPQHRDAIAHAADHVVANHGALDSRILITHLTKMNIYHSHQNQNTLKIMVTEARERVLAADIDWRPHYRGKKLTERYDSDHPNDTTVLLHWIAKKNPYGSPTEITRHAGEAGIQTAYHTLFEDAGKAILDAETHGHRSKNLRVSRESDLSAIDEHIDRILAENSSLNMTDALQRLRDKNITGTSGLLRNRISARKARHGDTTASNITSDTAGKNDSSSSATASNFLGNRLEVANHEHHELIERVAYVVAWANKLENSSDLVPKLAAEGVHGSDEQLSELLASAITEAETHGDRLLPASIDVPADRAEIQRRADLILADKPDLTTVDDDAKWLVHKLRIRHVKGTIEALDTFVRDILSPNRSHHTTDNAPSATIDDIYAGKAVVVPSPTGDVVAVPLPNNSGVAFVASNFVENVLHAFAHPSTLTGHFSIVVHHENGSYFLPKADGGGTAQSADQLVTTLDNLSDLSMPLTAWAVGTFSAEVYACNLTENSVSELQTAFSARGHLTSIHVTPYRFHTQIHIHRDGTITEGPALDDLPTETLVLVPKSETVHEATTGQEEPPITRGSSGRQRRVRQLPAPRPAKELDATAPVPAGPAAGPIAEFLAPGTGEFGG
ncbi:hypothetical protein MUY22_01355 [Amycolatopsis sp. WQ 127309]|nr:hypothetical protein MUY22_01355 [Amycolatopsis sp. WQ 127309]